MHDLTLPLSERTLLYPGDPAPVLTRVSDIRKGDPLTASHLQAGVHVGTHVDAPAHFLAEGRTLVELPLERFLGPAVVLDLRGRPAIGEQDLPGTDVPRRCHVLLRTDNSELLALDAFAEGHCHLTEAAAGRLGSLEPLSVGFDYYSLDPYGSTALPAHAALARRGIPVFVCLDLRGVEPGRYWFAGLPLRLGAPDGAPVRAILVDGPSLQALWGHFAGGATGSPRPVTR